MADDLVAFLQARLDEDEAEERARQGRIWRTETRQLREVEAKRRILELHEPQDWGGWRGQPVIPQCGYCASLCHSHSGLACDSPDAPYPCLTVRLLALPYADHASYWRGMEAVESGEVAQASLDVQGS